MAGSPCPVEVMKRVVAEMGMAEVTICYGMTETSPVSTQTGADDDLDRRTSTVGRVHPHLEVKVVDPATGLTVPRGETGEFCTRGYSVMLGYWNEPEKTAEVIDRARWMHTGDLAVMDAEGYLNIVGRIKDMVIRGGENVYPREIEEFLYTHPDIVDAQVIGVPDERYGEELMAWVRLREGAEPLTAEALRAFCAGKLAHYKVPALRQDRRRVPDDRHRQDPQGRDAHGLGRGARPAGRGGGQERLRAALVHRPGVSAASGLGLGGRRRGQPDDQLGQQAAHDDPDQRGQPVVDGLGDLRVRRREQVLGEPAERVPPAGGELTSGLSGLASNSTKTAWITISAAMTEQTTRTIVARSEKTRAEPVLAMGVMIYRARCRRDRISGTGPPAPPHPPARR